MKNKFIKFFAIGTIALSIIGCKKKETVVVTEAKEVVEVVASQVYKAILEKTNINWEAHQLVGGHKGAISASTGFLELKGAKLVGGNFIFDINTITCSDIPEGPKNEKLIGHLKSADFFDVETFSNAAFQITSVIEKEGKTMVSGNLTIKGVKKNITFPAKVLVTGSEVVLTSEEFDIDRTAFNIKYNSDKFADAASLGDHLIKDNVGIKVLVTATK